MSMIGYFHLSGRPDDLIMPVTYQSMEGDVAHLVLTFRLQLNLHQLISWLDDSFAVMSNEDTPPSSRGLNNLLTGMRLHCYG